MSSGGSILARRFYYWMKPHLPWAARMGFRRVFARRKRRSHRDVWPIDPAAGHVPHGWSGWPEGKQFAFVITHDVEGLLGLEQTSALLNLDAAQGFKSSFNFVPAGVYQVSAATRSEITSRGFEVGVHDLHHDGLLFDKEESFLAKADAINRYLSDWGSVGFRSGFMLRNLEWIHRLNIEYDSSTFDTDPFEFQPQGSKTIFPRWLKPHAEQIHPEEKQGYVELPYTLAQDSTLFILFQEKTTDLWRHKLDWIAEHGGMALVNVHPDYINFSSSSNARQYDAAFYSDFLEYVSKRYPGQYWNPLPKELARWFRATHSDLHSFREVSPSI